MNVVIRIIIALLLNMMILMFYSGEAIIELFDEGVVHHVELLESK